jgi:hypothetical protein
MRDSRRYLRLPLVVAISVLAGIGLVVATGSSAATTGKTCVVRQACQHHGTTYQVNSVKVTRTIGSGYFQERADGTFIVLNVTMTNTKSKSSTILDSNLTVRVRSGDEYDISDKALGIKNAFLLLENLQPKLPKTFLLIFDVPRTGVRGATLRINDSYTDDKATIRLGL